MNKMCLVVTPDIQKLADNILKAYPEQCQRIGFTTDMCAEWVGSYNMANNKPVDSVPDVKPLINYIEKTFNWSGKSFLYTPESITYTPKGKQRQTYTIIGNKIFNKKGQEVFRDDSKDRRKIFANLAVQQDRAVVVEHHGKKYVVNNRSQIISVATGDMMQWGEDNGDRKEILSSAQKEFAKMQTDIINQQENRLTNKNIEYGNDFRRIQETVRKGNPNTPGKGRISIDSRQRLAGVLRRELESQSSFNSSRQRVRVLTSASKQGNTSSFTIHSDVSPQLFHDVFEVVRFYTENGELVDLHDDYSDCKCYLNEDGTCGFAIEPDGNLVSVFNLGVRKRFLSTIKDFVIAEGASHLDAYNSSKQPLKEMYEHTLGAKTASTMDYNMAYDHDDIAKNHGEPDVVFMVMGKSAEKDIEEKHFNKDQYDEAVDWQMDNIDVEVPEGTAKSSIDFINNNPVFIQFKKDIDLLSGYYEGGGRVISDDLPNITNELDDKLNNYFMGGEELSIDDYRELWKLIEFYDDNGERGYRERKISTSSSLSNATTGNLAASAITFGAAPTAEQMAAAQARIDEARAAQPEKPRQEKPSSPAYESALRQEGNNHLKKFKQTFSPQQIKDRGAMISDVFSGIIDDLVADDIEENLAIINDGAASEEAKDNAKEEISKLRDPVRGRQYAAQKKGIEEIMKDIRQSIRNSMEFDEAYNEGKNKILYENTLEYFNDLFESQATLDIEEREGIRIVGQKIEGKTATEEEAENNDDGDDEVGNVATGSDGWGFKVRFTDPASTLSRKVKSMLYDIERPSTEKDDLGNTRRYPMGQIYASFLSYLSKHMETADDFVQPIKNFEDLPEQLWEMYDDFDGEKFNYLYPNGYPVFPVLEQMQKVYPWVNQVIEKLTNDYLNPEFVGDSNLRYPPTGGAIASQFYTNFKQAYIPYAKIQDKQGDLGIIPLNYEMEEKAQLDKLQANYNNRMILTDHSIYNSDGKINKENANWLKSKIGEAIGDVQSGKYIEYPELIAYSESNPENAVLTKEDIDEYNNFISDLRHILQSFGIDSSQDNVITYLMMDKGETLRGMLSNLEFIADLISKVNDEDVNNFNYMLDTNDKYGTNQWKNFFKDRGLITDASYMQSFYDSASKKTKYSYSADNYLMKTFRGCCMGTQEKRRKYIDEHYGKYEWFKNQSTGEWRNAWLEFWYNYKGDVKEIPYKNIDNITEQGDTAKIRPYIQWEKDDIWKVQDRSYDADSKRGTAYYLSPIFADSPMSMTMRGPKFSMEELLTGYTDNAGIKHQGALVRLVNQELYRIDLIQDRAEAIKEGTIKPIANFDGKRGLQFCFIPELNDYICPAAANYPEQPFIQRMVELKKGNASSDVLENTIIQALRNILNNKASEYISENNDRYLGENRGNLTGEQYGNMVYANAAIIQLTTIDLAFYKDDTDFQKRFKEVYAGGIELNTNSKYGKKTENIILVADDVITSPNYTEIAAIIDGSSNLSQKDKDDIKAKFTDINVADAQAIRSMHSFRSVLDMMGRWDDRMEEALNHFQQGTWSREDFDVIYQIIKPFVYSVIERNNGVGGTMLVPQQNKNSEICALMMYDLITNGLNNSPVYKAFSRFMENTVDASGTPLIDMIQYESAGKVGNQGVVNVSFNPNKVVHAIDNGIVINGREYELDSAYEDGKYLKNDVDNAEANYKAIKKQLDDKLQNSEMPQEDYNIIMEYLRPTEEEIISMLEKATLISNLDGSKGINSEFVHTIPFANYYQQQPTPEHHIDAETMFGSQSRNIIVADLPADFELTLQGKKGSKTFKGNNEIVDFYYDLLNENLIEDFFGKGGKKGLKGLFSSKESLREAVEEIVRGNPKYGRDFAEALKTDENGNFVLSPNSPTIFPLMQEIVTSFFKNRITKQKINGAALIQAAGIGLDEKLRIKFDEDGKLLGAECYMPLTSKKLFEPLLETHIINGEEVKVLSPKKLRQAGIDKAVGYRIPTENKSSMMPLIIKGFTPQQNGSAIILPAEITTMAGSDFDVDKMYVMLSSFYIDRYKMKEARENYAYQKGMADIIATIFPNSDYADELSEEDPDDFKIWFEENKDKYEREKPFIRQIKYDFSKSPKENGRKARNNMLIQLMYNILTSKEGSESLFNPQGFPDVEHAAKVTRILNDDNLRAKIEEQEGGIDEAIQYLLNADTDKLKDFIKDNSPAESPIYPQTFTHSHARNMAGAIQIGIYAIQGSMCAKYQRANVRLRPEHQFKLNGRDITNVDVSDGGKRLKNLGQMIGASADNGKNPNLTDMGSTTQTAPIIGYLLRLGLSHLEAALIVNQPEMLEANFSSEKLKSNVFGNKSPLYMKTEDVTSEMLMRNMMGDVTGNETTSIAAMCYKILKQAEAQQYLRNISRFDSPNGAMQNSYAKARVQQYNVDLFQAKMGQNDFPFVRINEALSNKNVDTSASENTVREQLHNQPMGLLQGMYHLGVHSFNDLVSPYFFGAEKWFDERIVKPILYNLNYKSADATKADIVDKIYKSYITFTLSSSPLFGNEEGASMKEKRSYYLESFPLDYLKIIGENKDIRDLLSPILQVDQFGSRRRVVLKDVGSLSKGQKADIQRRFEGLLYSDNSTARELAKDLFIYSYYDNGLQFTHDSFSHLFTTTFITDFSAYTETLNHLDERIAEEEEKNFIAQFLLTYPEAAYNADKIIKEHEVYEDYIYVDLNEPRFRKNNKFVNEVLSPNPQFEGVSFYPYLSYAGDIYLLDEEALNEDPSHLKYDKVNRYATYKKLPLFSKEMSVTELAQEFPWSQAASEGLNTASVEDDLTSHNESDEDSALETSMYDSFESMPDYDIPEDVEAEVSQSKSDNYTEEGKGELRDPMCSI